MRHGLRLVPDETIDAARVQLELAPLSASAPGYVLDRALSDITVRYGARTARIVRLELEYPEANAAAIALAP